MFQPAELAVTSLNLPQTEDGETVYQGRRFSELHRPRAPTSPPSSDFDMSDSYHSKSDYLSKHRKNVDSIVASSMSGGKVCNVVRVVSSDLWLGCLLSFQNKLHSKVEKFRNYC